MGNTYSGTLDNSVTAVNRDGSNFLRTYVLPHDPRTPKQMKQRRKYTEANEVWKAFSEQEKGEYRARAKGTGMNGYCLFVSHYTRKRI
jgi:hypothetical protein